ncbi:Wzz/FepE/Etk N-terminal domain-containing protein [Methylobacterium persicinum]
MTYTSPIVRADEPHPDALPGLEHIDMRFAEDDPGATWIGDLVAAVRRQGLLLILWLLFCFAASLAYTLMAQPEYVSSAQIALEPRVRLPPAPTRRRRPRRSPRSSTARRPRASFRSCARCAT